MEQSNLRRGRVLLKSVASDARHWSLLKRDGRVLCGDRGSVALPQKAGCQYAFHIDLLRLGRYHVGELLALIAPLSSVLPPIMPAASSHPSSPKPRRSMLQQNLNLRLLTAFKNPSSRIKLPLLQPTPMRLLHRRRPTRHLNIRRLHVLLRQTGANLLVGLGVCLLAIARAIPHTLARDAGFERRVVGVRRGLGLGAFCAGGCGRSFGRW